MCGWLLGFRCGPKQGEREEAGRGGEEGLECEEAPEGGEGRDNGEEADEERLGERATAEVEGQPQRVLDEALCVCRGGSAKRRGEVQTRSPAGASASGGEGSEAHQGGIASRCHAEEASCSLTGSQDCWLGVNELQTRGEGGVSSV